MIRRTVPEQCGKASMPHSGGDDRGFVSAECTSGQLVAAGTLYFKESMMHIAKTEIPARIDVPGAVARQELEFGDATGYGKIAGEYFSLGAGTDIAPLLKGLENDLCQSPHWGYVLEGEVTVTYADGEQETITGGDLFYWPPGHTVKVSVDAELILFSPQAEHCPVVEHLDRQLTS